MVDTICTAVSICTWTKESLAWHFYDSEALRSTTHIHSGCHLLVILGQREKFIRRILQVSRTEDKRERSLEWSVCSRNKLTSM